MGLNGHNRGRLKPSAPRSRHSSCRLAPEAGAAVLFSSHAQTAQKHDPLDQKFAFDLDDAALDVVQDLVRLLEFALDRFEILLRLVAAKDA